MYFCYRHIRLDKNEPFYIGIGTKVDNASIFTREYKRAFEKSKSKRSQYWHKVANNGYAVEILYESENRGDVEAKEIEFISLYGLKCDGGTLVNFTYGGEKSTKFSKDRKDVLSKRMIGNTYSKGLHPSEETRKKISEAGRGRTVTEDTRRKISISKKGKPLSEVAIYNLMKLAENKRGVPLSEEHKRKLNETRIGRIQSNECKVKIGNSNRGKRRDRDARIKMRANSSVTRGVYCFNTDTTYVSIAECVRIIFNLQDAERTNSDFCNKKNGVRHVCIGRINSYRGYTFKFV